MNRTELFGGKIFGIFGSPAFEASFKGVLKKLKNEFPHGILYSLSPYGGYRLYEAQDRLDGDTRLLIRGENFRPVKEILIESLYDIIGEGFGFFCTQSQIDRYFCDNVDIYDLKYFASLNFTQSIIDSEIAIRMDDDVLSVATLKEFFAPTARYMSIMCAADAIFSGCTYTRIAADDLIEMLIDDDPELKIDAIEYAKNADPMMLTRENGKFIAKDLRAECLQRLIEVEKKTGLALDKTEYMDRGERADRQRHSFSF